MGNLLKGVSSESANVDARWPERKSPAEAQSLKPSPALRSGIRSFGTANAPRATTGASFNNSRRLMLLNLRLSIRKLMNVAAEESDTTQMRFAEWQKVTGYRHGRGYCTAVNRGAAPLHREAPFFNGLVVLVGQDTLFWAMML